MPAHDLALLTDAARAAGRIALAFWKQSPATWDKGGGHGPVTEADLAVNAMLEARLREARPDYGWLSEESADTADRLGRDRVFVVDPIDGTRAFIAGEESFAHSLAVVEHGEVTAGVVYLPALDRLYTASRGGEALCDGQPIRASTQAGIEGAQVLCNASSLAAEHWPGGVPDLRRSFRASLAYRLCLVAEGRWDGMILIRDAWEWDVAAGTLIALRAGATVSDARGAPLRFNAAPPLAAGVLAGAPGLHQALLARRPAQGQ